MRNTALLSLTIAALFLCSNAANATSACSQAVSDAMSIKAAAQFTNDTALFRSAISTQNLSVLGYACFVQAIQLEQANLYAYTGNQPSGPAINAVNQYLGSGLVATDGCVTPGLLTTNRTTYDTEMRKSYFRKSDTESGAPFDVSAIKTGHATKAGGTFVSHFVKITPGTAGAGSSCNQSAVVPSGVTTSSGGTEYFCTKPNCVYNGSGGCSTAGG